MRLKPLIGAHENVLDMRMPNCLILLAEDQPDIREVTRLYLEMEGYAVIEAIDGHDAIEKAVICKPDLVLMDLGMPFVDGVEAARAIRQIDEVADVPIVAVTGFGDLYAAEAREAGCNMVMQKPLALERLISIIDDFTGRAHTAE